MRKTKIVTTLGPASQTKDMIKGIIAAGSNAMRLNFSHGDHSYHGETIDNINAVRKETGANVSLILDTKGPEIRTGKFESDIIELKKGSKITITIEECVGNSERFSVTHKGIVDDVKKGETILVDDGLLGLEVVSVSKTEIECKVLNTAPIGTYKGINLPNSNVSLPALSDKDKADLKFGCEKDVDYIAASFIRSKSDVQTIRDFLDKNGGKDIKIISKIENQQGIDNFDEILELTDGVMVARGDLGVEIPIEELPFAQKTMIAKCNDAGKLVITATHMLESMVKNPRPTRAEIGDIANATLDGSDAVMLSGETAKGEYPIKSVETMAKISHNAEKYMHADFSTIDGDTDLATAITAGCVEAAEIASAKAIVALSRSGTTILNIRKLFPSMTILALSPEVKTVKQLAIVRGVVAANEDAKNVTGDALYATITKHLTENKIAKKGDKVAILNSAEPFVSATTNSFMIWDMK